MMWEMVVIEMFVSWVIFFMVVMKIFQWVNVYIFLVLWKMFVGLRGGVFLLWECELNVNK